MKIRLITFLILTSILAVIQPTLALIIETPREQELMLVDTALALFSLFLCLSIIIGLIIGFISKYILVSLKSPNKFLSFAGFNLLLFIGFVILFDLIGFIADLFYGDHWTEEADNVTLNLILKLIVFLLLGVGMIGITKVKKSPVKKLNKLLVIYGTVLTLVMLLLIIIVVVTDPEPNVLSCYGPTCPGNLLGQ